MFNTRRRPRVLNVMSVLAALSIVTCINSCGPPPDLSGTWDIEEWAQAGNPPVADHCLGEVVVVQGENGNFDFDWEVICDISGGPFMGPGSGTIGPLLLDQFAYVKVQGLGFAPPTGCTSTGTATGLYTAGPPEKIVWDVVGTIFCPGEPDLPITAHEVLTNHIPPPPM